MHEHPTDPPDDAPPKGDAGGFPSERPTGILCFACGGEERVLVKVGRGSYKAVTCSWCDGKGTMTATQARAWKARKKTP